MNWPLAHAHKEERNKVEEEEWEDVRLHWWIARLVLVLGLGVYVSIAYAWGRGQTGEARTGPQIGFGRAGAEVKELGEGSGQGERSLGDVKAGIFEGR